MAACEHGLYLIVQNRTWPLRVTNVGWYGQKISRIRIKEQPRRPPATIAVLMDQSRPPGDSVENETYKTVDCTSDSCRYISVRLASSSLRVYPMAFIRVTRGTHAPRVSAGPQLFVRYNAASCGRLSWPASFLSYKSNKGIRLT